MAYKLNVTEHADELLDNLMYYLIYRLKNKQAAKHLLDGIDVIYDRLEVNQSQSKYWLYFLPFVKIIKQIIYCMLSRSSEKLSDGIGL